MSLIIRCPAKLNLFLSVGQVDHRNFHPIRTVFQAISLFDELHIERSPTLSVECDSEEVPADNSVLRAARLLAEIADFPPVAVKLIKRIPAQSGLGGGSSDAAGMIRASRHLMTMRLSDHEFRAVTRALGSDVPFFLVGGRAKGEGYGEKLTPVADGDREWYVIAKQTVSCSTPETYRRLDDLSYEWREFATDGSLYNDFERVAPEESLELIGSLRKTGAYDAGLTGSGSAVFGRFYDQASADKAARTLKEDGCPFVEVAHSLTRSESLNIEQVETSSSLV